MPFHKRTPFPLAKRPNDMKPQELVFRVRFTKEIFRDYEEYLNRMNLYRQRVWTCKVTGKSNLTYEEALVSEKKATEKAQNFPEDLVASVLPHVQFSMLTLKDLVNSIAEKFQEQFFEGSELYGKKNHHTYPCKIVKVLENGFEVAWLDKNKNITGNTVLTPGDLIRRKLPFSRDMLKCFIRKSTYHSVPWMLHDKLAQKHGISIDLPEELKRNIFLKDGRVVRTRKRKQSEQDQQNIAVRNGELRACKRKKPGIESENYPKEEEDPIKYPIDDLLVQPATDDPVFSERPSPFADFKVPMDCVGDLLMVWDFCSSFARLLHLWPFSLDDFEKSLCHKDSTPVLIVECYATLLRLLLKDKGDYFMIIQKKTRKPKITLITWTEFLCDFLEMVGIVELCMCMSTIKRGHYSLLDIQVKLGIFRELVYQVLATDLVREKLDKYIEERQAIAATRREEAIEEARKKREEKERLKLESTGKLAENGGVEFIRRKSSVAINALQTQEDEDVAQKENRKASSQRSHFLDNSESRQVNSPCKTRKHMIEAVVTPESGSDSSRKEDQMISMTDDKEEVDKMSKEQRKEFLEREMEKRFIRTNLLGKDKYYNRYWFFRRDGRIFVETSDCTRWGYYNCKEQLDDFIGSLNQKGERERALKKQMEKCYSKICLALQKMSKEGACKIAIEEEAVLRRSTRIRAPPRKNPANAFLEYVNKWKE